MLRFSSSWEAEINKDTRTGQSMRVAVLAGYCQALLSWTFSRAYAFRPNFKHADVSIWNSESNIYFIRLAQALRERLINLNRCLKKAENKNKLFLRSKEVDFKSLMSSFLTSRQTALIILKRLREALQTGGMHLDFAGWRTDLTLKNKAGSEHKLPLQNAPVFGEGHLSFLSYSVWLQ